MQNQHDQIFRENFVEFFGAFIERYLKIQLRSTQDIPGDLQRTFERRPDFLKLVDSEDGEPFILHLEVQSRNDPNMINRMRTYHALLVEKYKLPVLQGVVLLGKRNRMRNRARPKEIFSGFEVLELARIGVDEFLSSEVPGEVILAVLADHGNRSSQGVIRAILERLMEVGETEGNIRKAFEQLLQISNLRNLIEVVEKEIETMPITFDFSKTSIYKKGEEKGLAKGLEKGEAQTQRRIARALLKAGELSIEKISSATGLPIEEVVAMRDK